MLRYAAALSGLLFTVAASAQVSGSAMVVSDYRVRGMSLSGGRPSAQLAAGYDGSGGWYAGVLVSAVRPATNIRALTLTYFGLVRAINTDLNWETGVQYASLTGPSRYAYPDAYIGFTSQRYSLRMHYAPRYFGSDVPTIYVALERSWRLSDDLQVVGHIGVQRRIRSSRYEQSRDRVDARAGLDRAWHSYHLQVFWTVARGSANDPFYNRRSYRSSREAWGISLSRSW